MKRVKRFEKLETNSPCFIGLYEIVGHFCKVSYALVSPTNFLVVHQVFYVSLIKKWISDPVLVVPLERFGVKDSFS